MRERGGGDPERWTSIRAPILIRDEKKCAYCGRRATTVDHIEPKVRGGSNEPWNLVACCKTCNTTKNDRTPEEAGMTFWGGFDQRKLRRELRGSDAIDSEVICQIPDSGVPSGSEVLTAGQRNTSFAREADGADEALKALERWSRQSGGHGLGSNDRDAAVRFVVAVGQDPPVVRSGSQTPCGLLIPEAVDGLIRDRVPYKNVKWALGCVRNRLSDWRSAPVSAIGDNGHIDSKAALKRLEDRQRGQPRRSRNP